MDVMDKANEMAAAIKETTEYLDLKQAFDMLKLDAVAYGVFQNFEMKQSELQQKAAQGVKITDDEMQELQAVGAKLQTSEAIVTLMDKEQAMAQLMDKLNGVVNDPIAQLYRPQN